MSAAQQSTPKLLIVGAGISGLALAHGCQKHHIPYHLYERDASPSTRAQGYRIRVGGGALPALRYLLTSDMHSDFEMTCADMKMRPIPGIDAHTGAVHVARGHHFDHEEDLRDDGETPRTVDRTVFREVLLKGLDKENISYGKSFSRYEETASGGVRVHFEDGSVAEGTLLVGADGSHSKVRTQFLPDLNIVDTGNMCIYGKTPLTPETLAKIDPALMEGICIVKDVSEDELVSMVVEAVTFPRRKQMEEKGYTCPDDYLYWVMGSSAKRMGFAESDNKHLSLQESEDLAARLSRTWYKSVKSILDDQAGEQTAMVPIASVTPDFGGVWEPQAHVTVMGDAVGLMGPTAGSGAVTALRDAHRLCELLVEEGQSKQTIGRYEAEMREYTGKTVAMSLEAGKHVFGRSSDAQPIEEMMMEMREKKMMQARQAVKAA